MHLVEPELAGLASIVYPGDQVIDVGAAHGMYTYPLARLVGRSGRVVAFEPQPRQRRALEVFSNFFRLHQVKVDDAALGARGGESILVLPKFLRVPIYGHAHLEATHPRKSGPWGYRAVSVRTIDSFCDQQGLEDLAFIKVDVEGFELDVVKGAQTMIERCRPSMLIEIEDRHTARYGHTGAEVVAHILNTWPEYRLYRWAKDAWIATDAVHPATRNYLFTVKVV
ncbi:FkbM family methyltransferase [Arthrobacter sp. AET 35A]|uniref:FkbM family methyltransferase n=1 Tax=Arthrobacter sp. AET 35A TaxID=2292643 RepID=UPI00178632BC|nr:FkbM family methyltransferase [Arthrobacter sp. AET 35A]